MTENRKFERTPIDEPLTFRAKGEVVAASGVGKNVSVGGMFIATTTVPAFGADIVVVIEAPREKSALMLPGTVRWKNNEGIGVQFGLLGARETHYITELTRRTPVPVES